MIALATLKIAVLARSKGECERLRWGKRTRS